MTPAALATLQRLARLKAQRALADLAAAKHRAVAADGAVRAMEDAVGASYSAADGADAVAMGRRRAALERRVESLRGAAAAQWAATEGVRSVAASAVARELGAEALADQAIEAARQADARRAERSAGVLSAIKATQGS